MLPARHTQGPGSGPMPCDRSVGLRFSLPSGRWDQALACRGLRSPSAHCLLWPLTQEGGLSLKHSADEGDSRRWGAYASVPRTQRSLVQTQDMRGFLSLSGDHESGG